jgi:hypothetical protein
LEVQCDATTTNAHQDTFMDLSLGQATIGAS